VIDLIKDNPNILLLFFLFSILFMVVALCCLFMRFRISRSSLDEIRRLDIGLYKKILGGNNISWIERRSDSILDFRIWINLSKELSKCDILINVVDADVCKRFVLLKKLMIFSYTISVFIGISVVFIGFIISNLS